MNLEKAKALLSEYKCFFCGEIADRVGFYQDYSLSEKETIENPTLFCASCWNELSNKKQIIPHGASIIRVYCKLFLTLGKMPTKEIGFLTGRKNYRINHLSSRFWRKMIFNIHYLNIPPKRETITIGKDLYQ